MREAEFVGKTYKDVKSSITFALLLKRYGSAYIHPNSQKSFHMERAGV